MLYSSFLLNRSKSCLFQKHSSTGTTHFSITQSSAKSVMNSLPEGLQQLLPGVAEKDSGNYICDSHNL